MRHRQPLAKAATLVIGLVVSWLLLGELATFVYFLIWFDIVFIYTKGAGTIGIDLTTIVAIMYGIALGPVLGFLFASIVLPAMIIVVMFLIWDFDMPIINVEFIFLGFTAGFAGLIAPFLPLFLTVLLAIAFRFGFSIAVVARFKSRPKIGYYLVNTLVSFMIIMAMNSLGVFSLIA